MSKTKVDKKNQGAKRQRNWRKTRPKHEERPPFFRHEKAAQRVSFGAGYPADVHADIPADVRWQNLRSGPWKSWKTQASISVRTSMTRRRGRPWIQGGFKNFGQKNFGLNFRTRFLGGCHAGAISTRSRGNCEILEPSLPNRRGFEPHSSSLQITICLSELRLFLSLVLLPLETPTQERMFCLSLPSDLPVPV